MTLNNFEQQAKERLKNRKIQPTERAWEEISGAIEMQQKPKSGYFWYGIAAGFIGILIITVFYFQGEEPTAIEQQIVVSPQERKVEESPELNEQPLLLPENKKKEERAVVSVEAVKNEKEQILKPEIEIEKIAAVDHHIEKDKLPKVELAFTEDVIDAKLEEVLARVNILERDTNALTDAEVDSLLRQAQREILTERIINEDNSIDATALLTEVEDELDQSFRNQIFDKLKTGFNKVRTAVADRNN